MSCNSPESAPVQCLGSCKYAQMADNVMVQLEAQQAKGSAALLGCPELLQSGQLLRCWASWQLPKSCSIFKTCLLLGTLSPHAYECS